MAAQLLHHPMLDDRCQTASAQRLAEAPVWNRRLNELGWAAYLGGPPADRYAAPARAEDPGGLPPTDLDVGDADLSPDEVFAFAARLAAAGGTVELHVDPNTVHGFGRVAPGAESSRIAGARRSRLRRRALNTNLL